MIAEVFSTRFPVEDRERLDNLARATGLTRGAVLRLLIRQATAIPNVGIVLQVQPAAEQK